MWKHFQCFSILDVSVKSKLVKCCNITRYRKCTNAPVNEMQHRRQLKSDFFPAEWQPPFEDTYYHCRLS